MKELESNINHPGADVQQEVDRIHYFNTTNLPEKEAQKENVIKGRQERIILAYMTEHSDKEFTTLQLIANNVLDSKVPENSYRRAICNLQSAGKIYHTRWVQGDYGKRIGSYKVSMPLPEIFF